MVAGVRKFVVTIDFGDCRVLLENNFAKFKSPKYLKDQGLFDPVNRLNPFGYVLHTEGHTV